LDFKSCLKTTVLKNQSFFQYFVKENKQKTTQMERHIFTLLSMLLLNFFLCCIATKTVPEDQIHLLNPNEEAMPVYQPPKFKQLSNFLIYPTPARFKHDIIPYLSTENVVKVYNHFRKFHPQLDLKKWLREGFITNSVVDITDSFENNFISIYISSIFVSSYFIFP